MAISQQLAKGSRESASIVPAVSIAYPTYPNSNLEHQPIYNNFSIPCKIETVSHIIRPLPQMVLSMEICL